MADWIAISGLATAGGTLALAVTTYASVRSANRAARVAELSLLAGLRPLLVESGESAETLRVNFYDIHGIAVPGGRAAIELVDESLYLVVSLRNVGSGIAVLHGGAVYPRPPRGSLFQPQLEDFRLLSRDLYIPPGDVGFWQIAWRTDEQPHRRSSSRRSRTAHSWPTSSTATSRAASVRWCDSGSRERRTAPGT